jgi:hypothetical protein
VPVAATVAPPVLTGGGRGATASTARATRGFGFDSPLGRFAIVGGGGLLGASARGAGGVSLVLPSGLAGLAALIGVVAVLAQRRVEQRRRVLR